MKKYVWTVLLLILLVLITRFVYVKSPQVEVQKSDPLCSQGIPYNSESQPSIFKQNNCDIIFNINRDYLTRVKPIFQDKCFVCHGNVDKMPLYSIIPPASWLVKNDIKGGKEHLNMTEDFPFYSKKKVINLEKQFSGLQKTIEKDQMPPWYYELLHWQSDLTTQEKQIILTWIKESQEKLK